MGLPDQPVQPAAAHVPVLLDRVIDLLSPALTSTSSVIIDATLGLGGHSQALLETHPSLRLIGLDRDPAALALSADRLHAYRNRITLIQANFDEITEVLAAEGIATVHAVLFDLGVSSMQLDRPERGFSYAQDAPLDMRMNPTQGPTAAEVVNTYPVARLATVIRQYGEERFALRVAQAIGRRRAKGPLSSTAELAELIRDAIPAATRRTGGHPAKRTFQALRIEVNGELDAITRALPAALQALALHGRIVVLAYHSLEDRIVKQAFAALATDRTPAGLPLPLMAAAPQLQLLTRGAEQASEQEIAANSRATSVRLRAVERVAGAAA